MNICKSYRSALVTLWSYRSAKSVSLFNSNNRGKRNKTIFLFQWMFCQSIFSSKSGVTLKQKLMWFFFVEIVRQFVVKFFLFLFFLFMSRNIENAGGTGGFSKSKIVEIRAMKVTHQQHILKKLDNHKFKIVMYNPNN